MIASTAPGCPPSVGLDSFDLSEHELQDFARKAAKSVQRLAMQWQSEGTTEQGIVRRLRQVTRHNHVQMPNKAGLQACLNRLTDHLWWRRALSKRFRVLEHAAIRLGHVHRHAAAYVSDGSMRRAARARQRIRRLLESLDAINESTGQVVPLHELVDASLANPKHRRSALMVRVKGIEQRAASLGHAALLLTVTCPSRMHARHITGAPNLRYDETTPRTAQRHLHGVWRRASRALQHQGIHCYGLRVVEPHHDGCPHWHVLAFMAPEHTEPVIETVRAYALADSPDEPGAAERRFNVKRIDPAEGSATGYVAKYVSKNIDGEGVEVEHETGLSAAESAQRVAVWAGLWGVRQFQFFGVPAITPTRELYRLDAAPAGSEGLQAAHEACRANDYGAWLQACATHELSFSSIYLDEPSKRYFGELSRRLCGISASARDLPSAIAITTRTDRWRIEPKPRPRDATEPVHGAPWTRFNNCARIDFIEFSRSDGPSMTQALAGADHLASDRAPPPRLADHPEGVPC